MPLPAESNAYARCLASLKCIRIMVHFGGFSEHGTAGFAFQWDDPICSREYGMRCSMRLAARTSRCYQPGRPHGYPSNR